MEQNENIPTLLQFLSFHLLEQKNLQKNLLSQSLTDLRIIDLRSRVIQTFFIYEKIKLLLFFIVFLFCVCNDIFHHDLVTQL